MTNNDLTTTDSHNEIQPFFVRALENVREDVRDNTYIVEALRVLPVGGYRSAIGHL